MNQRVLCLILTALVLLHNGAHAGGWGPTFAIEVHHDEFEQPLTITNPSILDNLTFWVGPGTGYSELMGPVAYGKSIVNWDRGEVQNKLEVLPYYEIRFLLGARDNPASYIVFYEPDRANNTGYIYYPKLSSSIVAHGVSGTWRYASERWNDEMGAAIADYVEHQSVRELARNRRASIP